MGKSCKQRQYQSRLRRDQIPGLKALTGLDDILFGGHKDEDISRLSPVTHLFNSPDGHIHIGCLTLVLLFRVNGQIFHNHRVSTSGDLHHRGPAKGL